jgi:methyl acetate hydrolase
MLRREDEKPGSLALLDASLTAAVAGGDVPFVVGAVADRERVLWAGSAGDAGAQIAGGWNSTMFTLMSMTKALGSACALLLAEQGRLSLEADVVALVPEFAEVKVLESVDSAGPRLRAPKRPVTVRHLLTNTAGLSYSTFHPKQLAYSALPDVPALGDGSLRSFMAPLMFDPGEGFAYGVGLDWVGVVVERLSGEAIDDFCRRELLGPLGMTDTVFDLDDERRARLAAHKGRNDQGGFDNIEFFPPSRPEHYGMGGALHGTAADYMRFMRMVLGRGTLDGQRLLSEASVNTMLSNQIGALSIPVLKSLLPVADDVDLFPESDGRTTWTTAFMRNEKDVPGRRRAGSVTWSGFLNTHYWIDPASGICGLFMTQVLPFCDKRVLTAHRSFERAVYAALRDGRLA